MTTSCGSFLKFPKKKKCYLKTEKELGFKLTFLWSLERHCPDSLAGPNLCPGQIFPSSHLSGMSLDMAATPGTCDKGELPQLHRCKTISVLSFYSEIWQKRTTGTNLGTVFDLLLHWKLPVQLLLQWPVRRSLLNSFDLESQGLIPCPPLSSELMEVPTCEGILPTSARGADCFLQQVHR